MMFAVDWKSTGLGSRLTELDNGNSEAVNDKLGPIEPSDEVERPQAKEVAK